MARDQNIFVWIVQVLILLINLNNFFYANAELHTCATLKSNSIGFQNSSLVLKAGTVLGNIAEEYLTCDKSWNVAAIWTVTPSCELKACSGSYLNGQCTTTSNADGSFPSGTWLSAQCKCASTCTCTSKKLKQSVCALAYLEPGGCNNCDAAYTELKEGSHLEFPDDWQEKVSMFVVRSGCSITVYDEEDHDGESETITGPQTKDWSGNVGSYECKCDDTSLQPGSSVGTQPSMSRGVDIPEALDGVVDELSKNNFDHPGLLAALSSVAHGRSTRNVYLMLIGSSGAGKSSAINILLGKENLTTAGDLQSTTSEILEFRVPLAIPEIGIKNSELRVIDTPGLGDTRGLQNDALFLATLDDYISNHEELKSKIPNLVLIFHTFEDNRFHGEGARFVRMVRGLDHIRPRITDESYSNVLFVFSHLCSAGKDLERNPLPRLMKFKEAIELYSLFPKPILTAVIENKGADNELVMRNGNFELPNKELYPQNLWTKFNAITNGGHDKIGNALVNSNTIRNRGANDEYTVTGTTYPLVSSSHNKVSQYLKILSSTAYHVNNSEVSGILAETYNGMDNSIKSRFPQALENLQRHLNVKSIMTKADVPKTSKAILELLSGIDQNQANVYLLEKGLDLKAPSFPSTIFVGFSYDILKDSFLSISPFKLDSFQLSSIGFMLPKAIRCTKTTVPSPAAPRKGFRVFDTKQLYFRHITHSLLGEKLSSIANSTQIFSVLTSKAKDGYFVKEITCEGQSDKYCFVVTRFYETFRFELESSPDLVKLQDDFIRRVENLSPFNESSHTSIENWSTFFNDFGTNVVTSGEGGGRIDIRFSISSQTPVEPAVQKIMKSFEFAEDPLGSVIRYKESSKSVFAAAESVSHVLTFRGGNQAFHVTDISKLNLEEAVKIMKNWKQSLKYYPVVFPKEVLPIGQVAKKYFLTGKKQNEIEEKIETAFGRLLTATLKYVEPTPDPKVVEELQRQQRENEERLKQLELERQRKAAEAEKQRLAAIAAQKKREQEERERIERRRREEEEKEAERKRQEAHRLWLQIQEAARRRREQEEADRRYRQRLREMEEEERRQREHLLWQQRQWEREWEEQARRRRSSCLKEGTKILLADTTEKPVELIKIGDVLLDKDLKPTRVLGVAYEFLLTQKFYGFDNETFFFTDTHLFADDNGESLQLYTTSSINLFAQNPLMKYLNISEFSSENENERTRILHYDSNSQSEKPVRREITVYQEEKNYPIETPIYFIQVDNPSGTYFAEGYVCRHEIPPLEYWPNTMSTLFTLFGTTGLETVAQMPYTLETIDQIDRISDDVKKTVLNVLQREFETSDFKYELHKEMGTCEKLSFDDFDLDAVVGNIFGNPTLSTLGMELYGNTGKVISKYLDDNSNKLTDCKVQKLQKILSETIREQIKLSLNIVSDDEPHN